MYVDCRPGSSTSSPSRSHDGVLLESSYVEYLRYARTSVQNCVNACRAWSAPYDGEYPTVESFSDNHQSMSAYSGNVLSEEVRKDVIPSSQDGLNMGGVNLKECVYKRIQTDAGVSGDGTVSSFNSNNLVSSATDDGITQAREIPVLSSSLTVSRLTSESVTDNAEVSTDTDYKQEQTCGESLPVSSSSNLNTAQPVVPPRHLSPASTSEDLESFFRQLSHVSCKSDSDDTTVDILTELDEVISQLDASPEDPDSQKTLTPEDQFASDFPENIQPQTENDIPAVQNSDLTATVASSDGTDNVQSSDDSLVKAHEGKVLDSSAGDDKDKDDDKDVDSSDGLHSKTSPFSLLLYCKYEPPYLPTVGMYMYTFVHSSCC